MKIIMLTLILLSASASVAQTNKTTTNTTYTDQYGNVIMRSESTTTPGSQHNRGAATIYDQKVVNRPLETFERQAQSPESQANYAEQARLKQQRRAERNQEAEVERNRKLNIKKTNQAARAAVKEMQDRGKKAEIEAAAARKKSRKESALLLPRHSRECISTGCAKKNLAGTYYCRKHEDG